MKSSSCLTWNLSRIFSVEVNAAEASSLRGLRRVSSTTSEDVLRFYQKRNKLTITRKPSPGFKAGKDVTCKYASLVELWRSWLRSRLLTKRYKREPREKETGALGKHSRRTTNHAYALPSPSQIPRNERQRLALFLMKAYLNRYRAIWG